VNPITKIFTALRVLAGHPVNRNRKLRAVLEYGFIQAAARLVPGDLCLEFPNQTRVLISPRMKGAAHYISPRLCEFEEMSLVMHFLRPDELFADVGANVGSFGVMAAGVAGARVVAFEPSPEVYAMLVRNVRINAFQDRFRPVNAAVGRSVGTLRFSTGLGTENHVSTPAEADQAVAIPMTSLDAEFATTPPVLLKVDVEGFESEVFAGAEQTLGNPVLQAVIVERNQSGNRYGYDEGKLHGQIRAHGFTPCFYHPLERKLESVGPDACGNIIYVRDFQAAGTRLRTAAPYQLGDLRV